MATIEACWRPSPEKIVTNIRDAMQLVAESVETSPRDVAIGVRDIRSALGDAAVTGSSIDETLLTSAHEVVTIHGPAAGEYWHAQAVAWVRNRPD